MVPYKNIINRFRVKLLGLRIYNRFKIMSFDFMFEYNCFKIMSFDFMFEFKIFNLQSSLFRILEVLYIPALNSAYWGMKILDMYSGDNWGVFLDALQGA